MNYEQELRHYDTFVTNPGALNERIERATGLVSSETLAEQMDTKPKRVAVDVMVPNHCSEKCIGCYFQERGRHPNIGLDKQTINGLQTMSERLAGENGDIFCLYPREVTTALPMLELFPEYGQDQILSNGKLLHLPGVLDRIRQAGVNLINITCPGSRESFMEYTNEPAENYDRLLSNIQLAMKSGLEVNVYMPIYKKNVDEVVPTVQMLGELGIRKIDFIRMAPMGHGFKLPTAKFIYDEDVLRFLRNLNESRHLTKGKMHLSLFKGSWGVNFYNKSVFQYLSGQEVIYPKSRYFCPMIDEQYLGVMMGSNKVYGCFLGVSFEEFEIGTYSEKGLQIDRHMPGSEWLHKNLRGMCSADNCPEHDLCLGGCRANAFSWAKQRGEAEPIAAGQDFCITDFLRNLEK